MKQIKKLILLFIIFVIGINKVNAAGNYTISLSANNVSKGKSVTLYIKGNNIAGGFNAQSSDSTTCSLSTTLVWVDNDTQSIRVNASKTGSCTIKVSPTSVSDYNGKDLNLASKSVTLNINGGTSSSNNTSNNNSSNEQVRKSNDATLKSLTIDNVSLTPEFNAKTLEYSTSFDAGTEKVKVNAEANSSKATVTGTGEVKVSEGINKLQIIVTAEDGSTKTYLINATVKEYEPIKVKIGKKEYTVIRKESDLPEVDLFEKCKVSIGEEEVPGYYNDKLNIYLLALKDDKGQIAIYVYDTNKKTYIKYKWITVGGVTLYLKPSPTKIENFKKYSTTIKNTKLNIYKTNKKNPIGLIYGTNVVTGNTGFYVYDKKEETLARYYNEEVNLYKDKLTKYRNYSMLGMGTISIVIIIIIIISLIRGRKRGRKIK